MKPHGPQEYQSHPLSRMYLNKTVEAEKAGEKLEVALLRYEYLRRMLTEGGITQQEDRIRALNTLALLATVI